MKDFFDAKQVPEVSLWYRAVKRGMDLVLSALGLVICSPVMLGAAIAVKEYDGGPVLYCQRRLTENGREFTILKFRSMRVDAEADGVARLASQGDNRITPVGQFLRKTHLDELPQLINIWRGEMSLVGPRPERPELVAQYETYLPEYALRLQMKAGLTGYAQIYGSYETQPREKLQMDLWYLANRSIALDCKLIAMTAVQLLFSLFHVAEKAEKGDHRVGNR